MKLSRSLAAACSRVRSLDRLTPIVVIAFGTVPAGEDLLHLLQAPDQLQLLCDLEFGTDGVEDSVVDLVDDHGVAPPHVARQHVLGELTQLLLDLADLGHGATSASPRPPPSTRPAGAVQRWQGHATSSRYRGD